MLDFGGAGGVAMVSRALLCLQIGEVLSVTARWRVALAQRWRAGGAVVAVFSTCRTDLCSSDAAMPDCKASVAIELR